MSAEDTEAFLMKINRQLGRGSEFRFVSWFLFLELKNHPPKLVTRSQMKLDGLGPRIQMGGGCECYIFETSRGMMRGIGNSYISWMSHGFQFPRLKKCLKPRARNLAAIHEQPDVDEVNCWIVDFLHTFLKKEPKWNSNLRFSLFHWISYQFLVILHKTSSSPLKIEGWKMEFDRLSSGVM